MMFFKEPPSPRLKICVVIPVKDEAENITSTLDALRLQESQNGIPIDSGIFEVLLLANNCSDATFAIACAYKNKFVDFPMQMEQISFPKEHAHIGKARRFLMDQAYSRFMSIQNPKGIIASTDGDTQVDKFWIREIIREMEKGNDVVGGNIFSDLAESPSKSYYEHDIEYQNLIAEIEGLIDPLEHNPLPTHFQCFGASFSVNCQMYDLAGRMPEIHCLEDIAFVKALELKDAKIRKSPLVKVFTSARKAGRVEKGLSQHLSYFESLSENKEPHLVPCAEAVLSCIKIKKAIREIWKSYQTKGKVNLELFRPPLKADLFANLSQINYFGVLWLGIYDYLQDKKWFEQWDVTDIKIAISDLKNERSALLNKRESESFKVASFGS